MKKLTYESSNTYSIICPCCGIDELERSAQGMARCTRCDRLLDLAGNGAHRASLRSWRSFGGRLPGGFRLGHVEPDSQRQPVFLETVPRLLVPIDAVARQLTSTG